MHAAVLFTTLMAQAAAPAAAPRMMSVDVAKSSAAYTIVHKLHKVRGESRELQGKVALQPDGTVQVMVRAPVATFLSGDGNRDEHMRETMEDSKFPLVAYKGVCHLAGDQPTSVDLVLDGELDFHGTRRPVSIPVHVDFSADGRAHVTGHFKISLDQHHVQRPSLLLVRIDDDCQVDLDLTLKETH